MPDHVLGHSDPELRRLSEQGRLYEAGTRDMIRAVGVKPGDHVLDAGCGAGDVSLLLAEAVGPGGGWWRWTVRRTAWRSAPGHPVRNAAP